MIDRLDPVIGRAGDRLRRAVARAVVVVDVDDPVADRVVAGNGGKQREVPALGVPCDPDLPVGVSGGGGRQIVHAKLFGGDAVFRQHIQILLPARDRIVCAAEDDEDRFLIGQQRQPRELDDLFFIVISAHARDADFGEAAEIAQQQHFTRRAVPQQQTQRKNLTAVFFIQRRERLREIHRRLRLKLIGHDLLDGAVHRAQKRERVHLAEGQLPERKLAEFPHVILHKCHTDHSCI